MPMTPHKLARELDSTRPSGALGSRSTPLAQARPADRLVPASSRLAAAAKRSKGRGTTV